MKTLLLSLAIAAGLTAQQPFNVKVSGHGPSMILIPGLSCPGEVWDSTVAHYQDRYQIHVLSLAGFAGLPRTPGPMLPKVREALAAYIRSNRLSKPVIVGHSLGGYAALDLASHYPDLPGKLVIVDAYPFFAGIAAPDTTPEQALSNAALMRKGMEAQSQDDYNRYVKSGMATRAMVTADADLERTIAWSLASDRSAVTDAVTELFSSDLRKDIEAIRSPTLVLGSWIAYKQYTDRARIEANLKLQYAKLAGVRIEITDSARHFIMWDDPQWMFTRIDQFLKPAPQVSGR